MTHRIFILNGEGGYYWPETLEGESFVGRSLYFCGQTHPILFQREDGVLVVSEKVQE